MREGDKFLRGLLAPVRGFYLVITSFRLMLYAAMPFCICIIIAMFALTSILKRTPQLMQNLYLWVPGLNKLAEYTAVGGFSFFALLMQGVFWIIVTIFIGYFSYIFLSIIGAPFYSLLAERILKAKGAKPFEATGFWHWMKTSFRMLILNALKLVFFMCLSAILFMLAFIPAIVVVIPFLIGLLVAYDCFDFSFECMTMTLSQRFNFFTDNFIAFLGLSLSILIVGVIPGLFTICLPFFIAGGADLCAYLLVNHYQRADYERRTT